jgi:hypothetical protein
LGNPVQLAVVPMEHFFERVLLTCDVRGEQLRIGAIPERPHSRTLNGAEGGI